MATASEKTDVMSAVQKWDDGFNTGDIKMASVWCADETSIIDDLPPHEWHGAGACSRWMGDALEFFKKTGLTDVKSTLGKPRHVDVAGDLAYVVVPATLTYKDKGKPSRDKPATVTMSLKTTASGWRITGWAWADG